MTNNNPKCCNKPMGLHIDHRQIDGGVQHVKIWMCLVCGKTQENDTIDFGASALSLAFQRARG